ncbi:XrtA/PEP-CTERM system histidine kinase PrsK [Flavisphingomonas formosensis]|uniref:XrtA/PEP-CTERM system histidine kinase PrsK n=1 Tax=Flavisphingomonas formosensis TaxID=861534 RepID=UPI0012F82D04|nr:XrtA/PEP-CTERM system histidine kinase PrsK [Sphingomonas formosensis]
MLTDGIILWSHAAAAALYAALAIWQLRRQQQGLQLRMLAFAFAITCAWSLIVAVVGPQAIPAQISESARNLGWLGFMLVLLTKAQEDDRRPAIVLLYALLSLVIVAQCVVDLLPRLVGEGASPDKAFFFAGLVLRMTVAIGALLLVHNLYTAAAPEARWGIRLPMVSLAAMWTYDLNLYTVAYLAHGWSSELFAGRGIAMLMLAPLFALGSRRNAKWKMRLSRAAAFQTLSLVAIGGYLVAMVIVTRLMQFIGGDHAQLAGVVTIFVMTIAAFLLLPSGRMRAWLKVTIAKHFFQHRYDYRTEWLRFTDTLGLPGTTAAPLDQRVIKAIADITESPGGLLLSVEESGGLATAERWNWAMVHPPAHAGNAALVHYLAETGRIVELDMVRAGIGEGARREAPLVPDWIMAEPRAWAAVPLVHFQRLVGVVLLERPRVDRTLDWEDFDLLRVAGRQAASYLAEARGQEALSDSKKFDEFNRRFAFIMHDIKNLVSQLSLVARNAERHADNPEFRADMVATLKASVGKMNDLLARLSQHNKGRAEEPRPIALKALAEAVAAPRRGGHAIAVEGRADVIAKADPVRLEQALAHLVQNAVDASPADVAVTLRIEPRGGDATIDIIDRGAGMSPDFVRTRLFKPFSSTKQGGFGVGAYEARTLVATMGGRLEVESREGEGSRFSIVLPLADGSTDESSYLSRAWERGG